MAANRIMKNETSLVVTNGHRNDEIADIVVTKCFCGKTVVAGLNVEKPLCSTHLFEESDREEIIRGSRVTVRKHEQSI